MLIPVLGRSGFGKTTYVKEKAKELANQGKKCMVIVPEQFTFEMERDIYLSAKGSPVAVQVVSFTRLCKKVFERFGGIAGRYIDKSAKIILMNRAIEELTDSLDIYSKSASRVDFVEKALEIVEEFKGAGVSPDELEDSLDVADDENLKKKLSDISKIYTTYQAMVEVSYFDPSDNLARCLKTLEENDFFEDCCVLIDSFAIFSSVQHKIIKIMAESCEQLFITFTSDSMADIKKGMGVFSPTKEGLTRIISDARSVGAEVAVPVILQENYRAKKQSISGLEECLAYEDFLEKLEDYEGVELYEEENPYGEIENLAVRIGNLVRKKNMRYKEIAVLGRSLDRYETAITDVFPKYDIPYFMDRREEISAISIIAFMLAVMDVLRNGYNTEGVLALAKSPCLNLDINAVGELENYCYIWSISKDKWLSNFENKVEGLHYGERQDDRKNLLEINNLRKRIVEPIKSLKNKINSCNGQDFSIAVYDFMEDIGVKENLFSYYSGEDEDMKYCLEINSRGYGMIIEVLDNISLLIGERVVSQNKLFDIFRLCLTSLDMGVIPKTLDGVTIGTADRTRLNNPKAVFIIGANFGVFPAQSGESGIFSDKEREKIRNIGLEITAPSDKRSVNELFYVYSALTAPSEQLSISYCMSLPDGSCCSPSPIVENILNLFGENVVGQKISLEEKILNSKTLFRTAFRYKTFKEKGYGAVLKCLDEQEMKQRYIKVRGFGEKRRYKIEDKAVAAKLFGGAYTVSPSGIENYFKCPFAYFCNYGLKLKKPRKIEFSPMESGTIIHYVLEKIVKKYGGQGLKDVDEKALKDEIHKVIEQFANEYIGTEKLLTQRFIYLLHRVEGILLKIILNIREEFSKSEFETVEFEYRIKQDGDTPPLCITVDKDNTIYVEGVVDRVDLWQSPTGVSYIRVVDYKSGQKAFKLNDVYNGLSLQMLIYLFSLCKKYRDVQNILPAGVLYMPTKDSVVKTDRNADDSYVEKEREKQFKMSGILLGDGDCLQAMESGLGGKHIPAKIKKDGTLYAYSSVASRKQFQLLENYIEYRIRTMGEKLREGEIDAVPMKIGNKLPCEYCDYRSVCKIEEDGEVCEYIDSDRKEVFKLMEEECED